MSDQEFQAAFKSGSLPEAKFDHEGHVRMAWIYLNESPLLQAIGAFKTDLVSFATALGAPKKYHETITWFYLLLINERMQTNSHSTWSEFAAHHPDVVQKENPIIHQFYSKQRLKLPLARTTPLLPDQPR